MKDRPDDSKSRASDKYWQGSAASFDAHYESGVFARAFLRERTRVLWSMLRVSGNSRVADIGCGSGVQLIELSRRVAHVAGFDYSAQMVAITEDRIASSGTRNATVKLCDAYNLKAINEEFDAVLALGLLDYLDDVPRAIMEMSRVSRKGAHIVVTMPKTPSLFSFLRGGPGLWLREKVFRLPPILFTATRFRAVDLIETAGFQVMECRALWTTMWMIHAVKMGPGMQGDS